LRPRSEQADQVARLELVGVLDERAQVADPEIGAAGIELVGERERGKRREAGGAAAADGLSGAVDQALVGEELRARHAVVDVDDAPLALEPLAVRLAVAGRAAVVHVENGEAPAREQLDARREARERGRGGTAVARDDERRQLAIGAIEGPAGRRVVVAERGSIAG